MKKKHLNLEILPIVQADFDAPCNSCRHLHNGCGYAYNNARECLLGRGVTGVLFRWEPHMDKTIKMSMRYPDERG
jgi:hypothetical protein